MNNQIRVIVVPDENENSMYYDLNGICENADSIYWTLVPYEMFDIYESSPYFVTDIINHSDVSEYVTWWR